MYPRNFDYQRAGSVKEAIDLLKERENARLLAGGHSLIPLMKLRQVVVGTLVDIGQIGELRTIRGQNGSVMIGPLNTHAMISASDALPAALREAAGKVGDWQVRNRGTLGGNVAHADPASDHPTVLIALGATFHMLGSSGERSVAAQEFFTGLFETSLGPDEVLTAIEVPVTMKGTGTAYIKMANPASGYAMLGVAAMITLNGQECSAASVAIGGLTPKATKARSVEAALVGKKLDKAVIAAAAEAVADDLKGDLLGDLQASAEYRRAMAPVYVACTLTEAVERAGRL
jgi:carbon-monoxide dehydrogenase medium subunit